MIEARGSGYRDRRRIENLRQQCMAKAVDQGRGAITTSDSSPSTTPVPPDPRADDVDAVRTERLTKRFGRTTAVDGLDLRVAQGEVFGFLGPNGAGTSTVIRMLPRQVRAARPSRLRSHPRGGACGGDR